MPAFTQTHVPEAVPLGNVELPGALNYHHDIDGNLSSGASSAGTALESILKMAEGVNIARNAADPTVTRAAYRAKIEKAVDGFNRDATAKLDNARKAVAASLKEAEIKLAHTVGITASDNAAEIRTVLRSLPADQRHAEIAKAFKNGNREIIGAVVGFDQLMHGCNPEAVTAMVDEYQRAVAPAEYSAVAAHKKYAGYVDNAGRSLMAFTTRALKGTGGYESKREATVAVLKSYGIDFEG